MSFEMTREEAADLAKFVERLRRRLPGDPWHKPGIEDALGQARKRATAPDLACAAIRAAEIPTNRTPAVIGMDGPHWREATRPPRPLQVDRKDRCTQCSEHRDDCERKWAGDHEFTSIADIAPPDAETRAELLAQARAGVVKRAPEPVRPGLAAMVKASPRVAEMKAQVAAARQALAEEATTGGASA